MLRHLTSLLIVLFFGAMMALLMRDHILPWIKAGDSIGVSTAQIADSWSGKDEYTEVFVGTTKLGKIRTVAERQGSGYGAWMVFQAEPRFLSARLEAVARMNSRLELAQIELHARTAGSEKPMITVSGLVEDDELLLRMESETGRRFTAIPLDRPLTLNLSADSFIASDQLVLGQTYALDVYDPLFGMQAGRMEITLTGSEQILVGGPGGQVMQAAVIEATIPNGSMKMWLDESRLPVRRVITLGGQSTPTESTQAAAPQIVIRMDRIDDPLVRQSIASLQALPPLPDLEPGMMRGEDSGDPVQALGLVGLLLRTGGPETLDSLIGGRTAKPPHSPAEEPDAAH